MSYIAVTLHTYTFLMPLIAFSFAGDGSVAQLLLTVMGRAMHCRAALFLALMAALPLLSEAAQQPRPVVISQVDDRDGVVSAVVTVLDSAGRPVSGLSAGAFRAAIDGTEGSALDVQYAADPNAGLALVLTIDVSGSMAGPRLAAAKQAAGALLETLGANDRVALVAFNQNVAYFADYTGDFAAVRAAINSLGAAGNTSLYRASIASIEKAQSAPLQRRAVVLLTDGENVEPGGTVTRAAAIERATAAGVPVYAVGLGGEADQQFLDELARVSRGGSRFAPAPGDLSALYRGLAEELRGQYILRVRPRPVQPAASHTIRIDVVTPAGSFTDEARFAGGSLATVTPVPTGTPTATPSPVVTPAATPALPTATPAPIIAPVAEPARNSSNTGLWLAAFALTVLVASSLVATVLWRRRGAREAGDLPPVEGVRGPLPAPRSAAPVEATPAQIEVAGGSTTVALLLVGDDPVTIGTAADCTLVLPAEGLAAGQRYARLWSRDGRYMLHRLSPSAGDDQLPQWAVLEDHDEFCIGPYRLTFRLRDQAPAASR